MSTVPALSATETVVKPVGHVEIADMPSWDAQPPCQWNAKCPGRECDDPADVRIRTHVSGPRHGDFVYTLCVDHFAAYCRYVERELALVPSGMSGTCGVCGKSLRRVSDFIVSVTPL